MAYMGVRFPLLRARTRELGMTDAQLARMIGMSPEAYSMKLRGKTEFSMPEAMAIIKRLRLPVCDLWRVFSPGRTD